jgi:aryl-alcohol dehydrogenase
MIDIQAAVVRAQGAAFEIESLLLEDPGSGEVLVRIAGVGACHTDLVVRDQYFPASLPAVLEHEGAGIVERIGTGVTKVAPGNHVVLTYASCGQFANRLSGLCGYCPDLYGRDFAGTRPDGSHPCRDAHGYQVSSYLFAQSSFADLALATERNERDRPASRRATFSRESPGFSASAVYGRPPCREAAGAASGASG